MGNHPSAASSEGQAQSRSRGLLRQANALGLSKTELEQRCQPSGLYESCQWEPKAIRRLIGDGKIAARLKGNEGRQSESEHECPICFLNYGEINVTKCCKANLCTECYLQVRPQKEKSSCCPFCNHAKLTVQVAKALDASAIHERESAEQRVIEAKIRSRSCTLDDDNENGLPAKACVPTEPDGFGSSLAQHAALMRARSGSLAESDDANNGNKSDDVASMAMTPEARRALEDEMRAQHFHPVAQRVEQEEAMRRVQNEQEYSRNHPRDYRRELLSQSAAGSRSRRGRGTREAASMVAFPTNRPRTARGWNRIVESFENGGNDSINSLDDLVVLEAAIMLSREEEARRGGDSSEGEDGNARAEQHASEGFPLARARLQRRSDDNDDEDEITSFLRRRNTLHTTPSRSRANGAPRVALPMELAMMMGGPSEDEQIAMAIAASLAEQGAPSATESEETTDTNVTNPSIAESGAGEGLPDSHTLASRGVVTTGLLSSQEQPTDAKAAEPSTVLSDNLMPNIADMSPSSECGTPDVDTTASRSCSHHSSQRDAFL